MVDVLKHVSTEQLVKIFDYDVWHQSSLAPSKALTWLQALSSIDPELMLERYRELDEEYQVALIAKHVRAYEEEAFEKMSEMEQDALYQLPGGQIYYSISGLEQKAHEALVHFIETAAERDIEYAISLLGHTSFLPPNETEELIKQFRKARLEEDGFVDFEEGRSFFMPLKTKDFAQNLRIEPKSSAESKELTLETSKLFIDQVLAYSNELYPEKKETRQKSLMLLVNGIISATGVELDSLVEMKQILELTRGYLSFALEELSGADPKVAAELLNEKCNLKDLFRYALSCFYEIKKEFLVKLEQEAKIDSKSFSNNLNSLKFGNLLDGFDKKLRPIVGFEACEIIKAFFNRFPMVIEPKDEKSEAQHFFFKGISSIKDFETACSYLELCLKQATFEQQGR